MTGSLITMKSRPFVSPELLVLEPIGWVRHLYATVTAATTDEATAKNASFFKTGGNLYFCEFLICFGCIAVIVIIDTSRVEDIYKFFKPKQIMAAFATCYYANQMSQNSPLRLRY